MAEQLGRTIVAWELVAAPGEPPLLWDLDRRVGVSEPWGIAAERVEEIRTGIAARCDAESARRSQSGDAVRRGALLRR